MTYKKLLYLHDLDRRYVAKKLGISYGLLNVKLGGFSKWTPEEEAKLQALIKKAEKQGAVQ
jgi:hypothetical protein